MSDFMQSSYSVQKNTPFYDPWESLPKEVKQGVIRDKLSSYIHFAKEKVSWYQDRLKNFHPKAPHPLHEIPVLTATELRTLLPPQSRQLLSTSENRYTVFQSGGTTGVPKTTLFDHEELEKINPPNSRGFFACGLTSSDRVANLFAVGGLYMTFIHINRMLQQYGCMNFPFSNHTPADFIHSVTQLFQINVFTGIASVVLNALRKFPELGLENIKIEKVFYGGEHLYETDKKELMEKFGVHQILAPGYGTVDTWYLGYQCTHTKTGVFHAHDDESYIEIVNEDTQKHCEPNEAGMLYATAFPRRVTPIIRYRVGDRALWLHDPCSCGRTTPLFKLLGRGDDVLRIGYDSIDYAAIQEIVLQIPQLLGSIQIQKKREEGKDRLYIRVETEVDKNLYPLLSSELEKKLLLSRPSLHEFIQKQAIWPLCIELLPVGTIERNARTGKLIRVIDAI